MTIRRGMLCTLMARVLVGSRRRFRPHRPPRPPHARRRGDGAPRGAWGRTRDYQVLDGYWDDRNRNLHVPRLLDAEAGAVIPWAPERRGPQHPRSAVRPGGTGPVNTTSSSSGRTSRGRGNLLVRGGLARCTFPAGRNPRQDRVRPRRSVASAGPRTGAPASSSPPATGGSTITRSPRAMIAGPSRRRPVRSGGRRRRRGAARPTSGTRAGRPSRARGAGSSSR